MNTRQLLTVLALGITGAIVYTVAVLQKPVTFGISGPASSPIVSSGSPAKLKNTVAKNGQLAAKTSSAVVSLDSSGGSPFSEPVRKTPTSPDSVATPEVPSQIAEASPLPARVHGEKVLAQMNVKGRAMDLEPNQVGSFPRVLIDMGEKVSVTVNWPEARAGERVVAAVEDGGTLNRGQRVLPLNLDGALQIAFDFTAEQGPGIYRVTLRHGADVKTLELWAGPELALKSE